MKLDVSLAIGLLVGLLIFSVLPWLVGGTIGLAGYALGLVAGIYGASTLTGAVWLIGRLAKGQKTHPFATSLIATAVLFKLPAFTLAGRYLGNTPEPGPGCFGLAMVLVYSALVTLVAGSAPQK